MTTTAITWNQRFSSTERGARLARHLLLIQLESWGFPYEHMRETGHQHFRRSFVDFAELVLTQGLPVGLKPAKVERVRA